MSGPRALAGVAAAVAVVGGVTAAARLGLVEMSALEGTPSDVADGRVWLPFTSWLVADRPVALSLAAFALFAFAGMIVCGLRLLMVSAIVGHVGATLLVYLGVAAIRAVDPRALQDVVNYHDYGVSAVIAAWLGAIACIEWRKRRGRRERAAVVAVCLLCGLIGWLADSRRTPLDADHVVAFALGAGVAGARVRFRLAALLRILRPRAVARDQ